MHDQPIGKQGVLSLKPQHPKVLIVSSLFDSIACGLFFGLRYGHDMFFQNVIVLWRVYEYRISVKNWLKKGRTIFFMSFKVFKKVVCVENDYAATNSCRPRSARLDA